MVIDENTSAYLSIRGQRIDLENIYARNLSDEAFIADLRSQYQQGDALRHVVIDGLFSEKLLDLIVEEMESRKTAMNAIEFKTQKTLRSDNGPELGAAASLYFWAINSFPFVNFLSKITGNENIIVDHSLFAGGLHETPVGGFYAIHRDFNVHKYNRLNNAFVMMTYLNRDWHDEYGGALELWDAPTRRAVKSIRPDFGRTVILAHGPRSYHGHPEPLACPNGMTRKSIAAYYYTHRPTADNDTTFINSVFLDKIKAADPYTISKRQQFWASLELREKWAVFVNATMPPIAMWAYRRSKRKFSKAGPKF